MRKVARPAPKPRKYEMMIVVAPTVTEDGLPAVVERVTELIEAQEGSIESFTHDSPWGHRRLAYPIQNFRDAFYVLFYFHSAPRAITELERELRLDAAVIRHLIVKFDPLTVREGEGEAEATAEAPEAPAPAATSEETTDDAADTEAEADGGEESEPEPETTDSEEEDDGEADESDSESESTDSEEEDGGDDSDDDDAEETDADDGEDEDKDE